MTTREAQFSAMEAEAARHDRDRGSGEVAQPCPLRARRVKLRIVVKDRDYVIYRDCRYVLLAGAETFEGSTGPQGVVSHLVMESAREGLLRVWTQGAEQPAEEWLLEIAPFAPQELPEGFDARLGNLGFAAATGAHGSPEARFQSRFEATSGEEQRAETDDALRRVYSADDAEERAHRGWWVTGDITRTPEAGGERGPR